MPALRRDTNGNFVSRKRLPDDVREEYGRLHGAHWEAKFSAPASDGLIVATQKFRDWETNVASRIAAIRAAQRGDGFDLTWKAASGLAGEWYNWFVARHEENPGDPKHWENGFWLITDELLRFAPDKVRASPMKDFDWIKEDPAIRAGVRPVIADHGHTAEFLATRGIALTNEARVLFLDRVLDNFIQALLLLERRAEGDYEPDDLPRQFPPYPSAQRGPDNGRSPWDLFEAWIKAIEPAQSTIESWRTVFRALAKDFTDRSAASITPDEAQAWLDKLIDKERSAFTVHNTWLKATKTVFTWGTRRKLTSNPFSAAVVDVPKRKQYRPKWFHEDERATILNAAAAVKDTTSPDGVARRWVPWLLAYSGARPQEITQLRGNDVQQVDGIWALNVTPDAGSVKTMKARLVPIHDHLIEQGFLKFVRSSGNNPLFYRPRQKHSGPQRKSPAAQVRQRLAAWVREIGVTDEHLSPLHAWRHTFKLIGRRIEHDGTLLDYICGHAPATEGRGYGEPTLTDLARVIQRFPRYEV
jgi:integrase